MDAEDIFRALGYYRSMDVMRRLQRGPASFTQLKEGLAVGSSQLDHVLSSLVSAGLVEQRGRYYRPTSLGFQMLTVSNNLVRVDVRIIIL